MMYVESTRQFHPKKDGDDSGDTFLRLLAEAFDSAARGKRSVELRNVQVELLKLGWHP